MGRVEGKIAIVTGGAQGLGEAAVQRLSEGGAQVVLSDINSDAGTVTAAKYGATFITHDVREEDQWEALMAATLSRYGKLDILVNNAGIFTSCPVDETPLEDFRRVIDINLTGCFLGCKHGVRAMKKNPDGLGGSIINLSSVTGLRGQIGGAAYTSSKGGVRLLTKTVAVENAALQIRCNSIHPGTMYTPMVKALFDAAGDDATALEAIIERQTPLGRMGESGDIGDMVLFLASDDSKYVTGAEMVVDGGMTVGLPS
ncbi:MAG: 3(or 17)beta-hydroxysteroid dehydrogenase [Bacteroidia bacterium]|jgi:3(or 17)beta-hydroxysteroid dehydrogenase